MNAAVAVLLCAPAALNAADKPKAPAPKPAAAPKPAPKAAAPHTSTPAAHTSTTTTPHTATPGGTHTTTAAGTHTTATPHTTTPAGTHTTTPAGAHTATPAGGKTFGTGAGAKTTPAAGGKTFGGGGKTVTTKSGAQVHYNASGKVAVVHAHGMDIHHGPGGARTVVRTRPGGVTVVSNRYGHGYIGHPYRYHGVEYVHRTYYYNGRVYGRFYRPYTYWGVPLSVYSPGFYFAPAFYGWAYSPWAAPIAYPWGWAGNPWYGYYGAYFTPYPVYASPALWLTDYFVAQTLQAAYAERAAELANQQAQAQAPLTPDVKNAIAEEVRRQIALENSESAAGAAATPDPGSSGVARILADPTAHVFLVSAPLDVPSNAGGTCGITEGDVLQLNPGTPANSQTANLIVMASKGQDCLKGNTVQVNISDLQDMQNHMRETLDQGMNDLRAKQGQNGIPAAPAAARAEPVKTEFAAIAPPPDPNVKTELGDQTKEADQADREATNEAGPGPNAGTGGAGAAGGGTPPPPKTVTQGQTTDEVIAILGQPKNIVDLGAKKIYVYSDLKITFTGGKVSAVQ
ncbi:MAG TPA: hypothetical protein VKR61_15945 [Bryobacteraceae bacterium]|nr:hypothetical protein [Bryobacteraceae bacterium]